MNRKITAELRLDSLDSWVDILPGQNVKRRRPFRKWRDSGIGSFVFVAGLNVHGFVL